MCDAEEIPASMPLAIEPCLATGALLPAIEPYRLDFRALGCRGFLIKAARCSLPEKTL
jgi:hypothetical protein